MKKLLIFLISMALSTPTFAAARIKDIVNVEGVRENMLIGYGLVVGLNGTGDKLNNSQFTEKSLKGYLERLGVNVKADQLKTKNVAAVTITATLPAFARQGGKIDVRVSAMGDAKSLQGGTLLASPLMGADGEVFAVAQGPVAIGGFEAGGGSGGSVTKAIPTTGKIANGAIVEREVGFELNHMNFINLSLRNPDVTTARKVQDAINEKLVGDFAVATDPSTIRLEVPKEYQTKVAMLIADIEQQSVEPDNLARIVIDETSGTIVMGENVKIDTIAIAQGNLVIRVDESPNVSQPGAFAPEGAQTVTVPRSNIEIDEQSGNKMVTLQKGANLRDLVNGLNSLGVGPRDMITILQTIKAAGALQAEIEMI